MPGASGMLSLGMFNKAPKKAKKPAKAPKKMKPVAMKKGGMAKKKGK